ncbi:recombinase family protein [Rhodococcoides fascians]|uniref:recombinase family protein n=1 Tax=Rhodococcoides fascians TaxID=1828 RepID=UPI002E79CC57|nr:recombinase family protein [Rhodococcus fascians]
MTTMQALGQIEHGGPKLKGLRVIGYARVSTSAQEKGHGLGAQSDEMRRYCQANELQLLTVTYDVMSSGSVPKLFGRQTAIAAIESGLADGLLVRALDRATRDQLDAASIAKRANTNGWTLLDTQGANSSDASQRLLFDIRVAMAAEEKRKISERTKEGLRRAKAQGQQLGRPSKIDPSIVAEIIAMRTEDGLSAKGHRTQAGRVRRAHPRSGQPVAPQHDPSPAPARGRGLSMDTFALILVVILPIAFIVIGAIFGTGKK